MEYRCHVRTLLRTVGFVAGLAVCATATMAGAPRGQTDRSEFVAASPFWADEVKGDSVLIVFPGGQSDQVPQRDTRDDPCTLGAANTQARPAGTAPYPTFIGGSFNLEEFRYADDFTPAMNATVNRVCWRGVFSHIQCAFPEMGTADSAPHQWTIRFYTFGMDGLPGAQIGPDHVNFGGSPNMTVTQGRTGLPVGINPNDVEMSMSATLSGPAVSAGTCYYIEFYFDTPLPCFWLQGLSYEATTAPATAVGDRSLLRRNNRLFPNYTALDFINIDVSMSIGFDNGSALAKTNDFGSCFERFPPPNDNLADLFSNPGENPKLACGASVDFDNTYATHQPQFDPYSCRKSTIDPTDYTSGDVWWRWNPGTQTSASVSLCGTNTTGGLAGGDSLLAVFRSLVPTPTVPADLVQVGCSDDACLGTISQADITGLTNQTYYIRVSSFSPVSHGMYRLTITCPIPVPANDLCTGAIDIPRNPKGTGYGAPLGILLQGQTRTAGVDGNVRGCGGTGNSSRGVWYKLTGAGNQVLLSTDQQISGTAFDTTISVYCGPCDMMSPGNQLNCVAFNDDKSQTVLQSELDFCAHDGQTYYILIRGFGTASGDFGLLARELRDTNNNPIPCCEPEICDRDCGFEIPPNQTDEPGQNQDFSPTTEVCDDSAFNLTLQKNSGCSLTPGPGQIRPWGTITLGQVVVGNIWNRNQVFDRDWFLLRNQPTGTRFLVQFSCASEGPARFFTYGHAALTNFSNCTPAFTLVNLAPIFNGCPQELNRIIAYDGSATSQMGVQPGGEVGFRVDRSTSVADGYPCGTNTRYWFVFHEVVRTEDCTAVATQPGDDDEATQPTFNGGGGDDGFTAGEPCYNPVGEQYPGGPPFPPPNVPPGDFPRRKAGCGAPNPTDEGEFLLLRPGTPIVGKVDGTVGTAGASRDIDWYKFRLDQNAIVSMRVESAGVITAVLINDDCTINGITYLIAATRGTCSSNSANAEDIGVLPGDRTNYLVAAFWTDAFVTVGAGSLFGNYFCEDAISKYRLIVTADPLPDCSANPVCPPEGIVKAKESAEACSNNTDDHFDACAPDNDGCSRSVYGADTIASGETVCGTLWSTYDPFPLDDFTVDQDYYEFTVVNSTRLTYSMRANSPARVLVAETGLNGIKCLDPDFPVRVLGGENAGACVSGDVGVVYLEGSGNPLNPRYYTLVVSPGTLEQGLSIGDYRCAPFGKPIDYSLSVLMEEVGSCCLPTDNCVMVTASECMSAGGSDFDPDGFCGPSYSTDGLVAHAFVSIVGDPNAAQVTGFSDPDDSVVSVNMGAPFKLFGRVWGPQVGVSTNGYLIFGDDFSSAIARNYPNAANPNGIVAPFFHDWNLNSPGSSIWIKTSGPVGRETTIVEWANIGRHADFSQRANFQAVLIRNPDNNFQTKDDYFEFRYGTFTGLSKLDVTEADGDPSLASAGAEDETGLNGVGLPITPAFLTGNKKATFNLADTPCRTLVPVCCVGNADKVAPGQVTFADITAVLVNFFSVPNPNGTSVGDADCNGLINFADVTAVLVNWLNICN